MPKSKSGGRLKTSTTQPQLFAQRDSAGTEVKYFGLVRDEALSDLESGDKALAEVLKDIQDPAEASSVGTFSPTDLQILDGVARYDLKKEDFQILKGASINAENNSGVSSPLVNPRQRISDRITQAEGFAGRGTNYQGQGAVLYKYYVPETKPDGNVIKYSHTNPPPFFTESIDSAAENAPDFIPSTSAQIENSHRIGYIQNGKFVPNSEKEYWWSGEYNHYMASHAEYGRETQSALTNPKFPIVRDGNMKFDQIVPEGINTRYNWGLRFDMWLRREDLGPQFSLSTTMRWVAQVNGQLRIDYFDKSGQNSTTGAVTGAWKTALNTANPTTYYSQVSKESPVPNVLGSRLYYLQGGPTTNLGTGDGTLPTQRSSANGGALDLTATFTDREGNPATKFNGSDYVPVVIRFWYGQPSTNLAEVDSIFRQPLGPASFFIEMLDTDLSAGNLSKWNDYSSQLRLVRNADNRWEVDTTAGGSAAGEADFANYARTLEIIGYTPIGAGKPSSLNGYILANVPVIATKVAPTAPATTTSATFTVSGISPSVGSKIWVIARNRPINVIPELASRNLQSMWERFIFNPNPYGGYEGAVDLLEGVGANYAEPNPAKVPFEENLELYKAVYGNIPASSTYTSDRYDGTLTNSVTILNTERDYDYNHSKLLMIGRQKKGTVSEIGIVAPYVGKDLQAGEVRKKGGNYTFIDVVENKAGFGGNVIINAFPSNDLGVINTASTTTYGNALHMLDNTTTFSKSTRQNISTVQLNELPSDTDFASTGRVIYDEVDGQGRLSYGTWNGTAFTYDNTGVIAQLTMGVATRNHTDKSAFVAGFTKGSTDYNFYGLVGAQRTSFSSVTLVVKTGGETIDTVAGVFAPDSGGSNNNQYIGSEIYFPGDDPTNPATAKRVTSYVAATGTVTFSPSVTAGTYANCQVYYNHLQLGGSLPGNIVDSSGSGTKIVRASILAGSGAQSGRIVQIRYTFNSAYQYLRTDSGAGLSFGETLYVNAAASPTQSAPFASDTELPAPPADIVTPFGYDNSVGASDPGLGGLCYPPYSIQNVDLQTIVRATDADLYDETAGNFDVWWGSRIGGREEMGQKYLYVTDKLMFDFAASERVNLLSQLSTADKPTFVGSEYTHKLEVELKVALPSNASTAINANIYNDTRVYSNNKPVKDRYYLFVKKQDGGNGLSVLSANAPAWT